MVESQFVIAEPCAVTLAQVRQVVVVSHRWVSPHNPGVDSRDWRQAGATEHRRSSTGSVVVTATCATTPLSLSIIKTNEKTSAELWQVPEIEQWTFEQVQVVDGLAGGQDRAAIEWCCRFVFASPFVGFFKSQTHQHW